MNKPCYARVLNTNSNFPITHYILLSVREYTDYQGGTYIDEVKNINDVINNDLLAVDDIFYRVYGEKDNKELVYITEFSDIDEAKDFLFSISGKYPILELY